ncbi:Methyltransferase domain-containing protein [Rathayibacter oskolensis]|uniref:Methyltransferase domain-containing protein n=1 Tax=Rathayibacter oskolensis TaxID=1891671 RepID=A0A1X7PD24_9MICO|nr:methyltransferase [Rathayibacter oskolensis]SMH48989.1 Methyltransferase domain-containing protein [Rathayibacter oskolensis]
MTDEFVEANRANWDARVADHVIAYAAEAFADDPAANHVLTDLALMAPHLPNGSVEGLDLVHLQCHIGTDSLSWARLGARVTGTDFSAEAIAAARRLAERAGVDIDFVQTLNDDAPAVLARRFDVVFTSVGVLAWLADLDAWARAVHALLRPGGLFFLREGHPMMSALAYDRDDDLVVVDEPYFPTGAPLRSDDGATYASDTVLEEHATTYQWPHSLAEILGAVLGAGLTIVAFDEHTTLPWKALPSLVPTADGFALPSGRERLPLMFSLAARRPE